MSLRVDSSDPASLFSISGDELTPRPHTVQLYRDDAILLDALARFVGGALVAGDAAVVLATAAHRAALATRLAARGLDTSGAAVQGRYVSLDAADILTQVMRHGAPDAARFVALLGGIIDQAAAATSGERSGVAVFGELVALLCAEGHHGSAVQLEELWNALARTRAISLFCAYPVDVFPRAVDGLPFDAICAQHTRVVPAEDYMSLDDDAARLSAIAGLQQQARALATEIEQREHAEAAVRRGEAEVAEFSEANSRLAAIVDSSYDAIIGKTLDGTITDWNRAAEQLYGYTAAEIVGRSITTIVPLDRRAELADILARLACGERIAHHETERVRKDGTRVEVSVSISPIRDRAGRIVGASKIARDITERRALERQKQAFLEMIAHDLGSPLTTIQAHAQLMQRRQSYSERAVTAIIGEGRRMGRLVADVLATARLDAGRLELRRAPTDLVDLATNCVAQVRLLNGDQPIRVEAPQHPVVGSWDQDRLTQVLTNLLDNAVKYAPGSEVVVRVVDAPNEARVAVIDGGPGLTPDETDHIFERFFRAPSAASTASGVGLGLFISKQLVEAHGGRLWVESTPGRGSTFVVSLPRASTSPNGAEPLASSLDERA